MASVRHWLFEIGLDSYWGLLEGCGYATVDSLKSLNDHELINIGILDSNHRRAILNKIGPDDTLDSDFNNMLGDLSSVIKDLECFSVPTHIDTSVLPTNTSAPAPAQHTRKSYVFPQPSQPAADTDFDLDSLLNDLTSFDPNVAVAASHPPPSVVPQMQPHPPPPIHTAHPIAAGTPPQMATPEQRSVSSSAHSTPQHGRAYQQQGVAEPSPTPPSTPGTTPSHVPLRSYTQVDRDPQPRRDQVPEVIIRSYTEAKSSPDHKRPADEESRIVTVPVPDLSGATEQLDAEVLAQRLEDKAEELRNDPSLTDEEREQRLKEENIRIGIEKMKLAHKKRVAIKVFNPDHSNKTVVVEDGMTTNMVCHLLVVKNHFDESPNWVLVEQLGDVSLERELEDHENVVVVHSSWPREHNNVFLFKQNEKKYDLFEDPIKYFPDNLRSSQAANTKMGTLERAEKARKILLQEYFSSTSRVPELEGFLHLKDGYKKSWKKVFCILRASGLYYSLKGKQKTAKHLVQLVHFDDYELYHGINFRKMLKAPTSFCFALRPCPKAVLPSIKDIKVLCCDDEPTALSWTAGIRLAKYGLQLRDNYHKAKMTQFKLEELAAPEGAKSNVENRASKLVGLRLQKHLEKLREQYKAQKDEEETKRQFYHSPETARREGVDGSESSEGQLDGSMEVGGSLSELTPEPSPAITRREENNDSSNVEPPISSQVRVMPPPTAPKTAPKPRGPPPQVAPRPAAVQSQVVPQGPSAGQSQVVHQGPSAGQSQVVPQANGGTAGYNPYPPPTEAPPIPKEERLPSPQQPAPLPPLPPSPSAGAHFVAPPTAPPTRASPDKEALFAYAWYHGSIPRDEALRRLEGVGGYDGAYLVRDSTTVSNSYVLTMYAKSAAKNFQVLPVDHPNGMTMYRIDDGPGFVSIDQLLQHYKQDSDRLPCRLTEFCPRPPTRMTEC